MKLKIFDLLSKPGKKFVLLIDPDNYSVHSLIATIYTAEELKINMIFVAPTISE